MADVTRLVPDYSIRRMREEEIPAVLDIWKETGLSEGTYTLNTWFRFDPEGFFVAATDDGDLLGVCAGILQHEDLAFIGMYAVKSIYQRQGIGTRIWKAAIDRIGDRNVGVNPVPSQLANYRDRAGFPVQASWRSMVCVGAEVQTSELCSKIPGLEIRQLKADDPIMDDVVMYDASVNGFHRNNMVQLLTMERESVTMVAINTEENTVCGYGNIKKNIKGNALVGPLYADNICVAELIILHLIEEFPLAKTKGLTLMIIDQNEDAVRLVDNLGLTKQPGIARLYRKQEVDGNFSKIFGQHNLNFAVF